MDNTTDNTAFVPAPFNPADYEASDTGWLEVQSQSGDGPLLVNDRPVRFELFGPGSREYLRVQHEQEIANQAVAYATARGKANKETLDDRIKKNSIRLTALTRNIENFPIAAKDIYSNPKFGFIAAQVSRFIEDWANF